MDNRVFGHDSTGINVIFVAGNTVAFGIIDVGFVELDLDITHCEGVGRGLGVREVCEGCAYDCDRDERNAEANRCDLLFHVLLLLIKYSIVLFLRRAQWVTCLRCYSMPQKR